MNHINHTSSLRLNYNVQTALFKVHFLRSLFYRWFVSLFRSTKYIVFYSLSFLHLHFKVLFTWTIETCVHLVRERQLALLKQSCVLSVDNSLLGLDTGDSNRSWKSFAACSRTQTCLDMQPVLRATAARSLNNIPL